MVLPAVAATATTTACGQAPARPLPPPVPVVDVAMGDFRYDHPSTAPAGRVVFRVENRGGEDHSLTLARLPDDFESPVAELFRQQARTFAVTANLFPHGPGTRGTFAVDLAPGRYVLVCFLAGADGTKHLERGMFSELRVA